MRAQRASEAKVFITLVRCVFSQAKGREREICNYFASQALGPVQDAHLFATGEGEAAQGEGSSCV